jgi:regulator of sirC expression with transglutaminase-like and TPR domain
MKAATVDERLERLERRLDEIARDTAETAARIRERFPNDQEVAEAVELFLGEAFSDAA